MIKVILVEDHALFRLGLATVIAQKASDIEVIGEAESGAAFFALLKNTKPDLIVLDICLPDISGIEIARRMRLEYPKVKVLAISAENSRAIIEEMTDIGIDGFISKVNGKPNDIIAAIHAIMDGYDYFGDDISAVLYRVYVTKEQSQNALKCFSEREKEIIELCRQGMLAKQIAAELNISPRTVDNHKSNIFKKLGINSTLEMVNYAMRKGIIQL